MNTPRTVTMPDIYDAARGLRDVAVRTPFVGDPGVDALTGVPTLLKLESLQHTHSFKFRGAYNFVAALPDEQRAKGLIAASSGNHAQALARVARSIGVPATVVIPTDCPSSKVERIRQDGARIVTYRRDADDRDKIVEDIAAECGAQPVPSSNAPAVIAGNATVGLEVVQDTPDVGCILVPIGGGGLAAGSAIVGHHFGVEVIGVEPAGANDSYLSWHARSQVSIPSPTTIADGLRHHRPSELPMAINEHLLSDLVLVSDDAIVQAMRVAFGSLKVVAEPSGACALAALIAAPQRFQRYNRIVAVVSGGNVDLTTFQSLLAWVS